MTSRDGADADERIFESRAGQMPRRSRAAPPPAVVAEEAIGASDDTAPPRRGRAGRAPCGEDPKEEWGASASAGRRWRVGAGVRRETEPAT